MLLDHPSDGQTAIRTQFGAIFVSLELSRSTWLVTSLSPGNSEKMSKYSVKAGALPELLKLFSELKQKALARSGESYRIVTIQEAGLDGFWLHRALQQEGVESHALDLLRTGDGRVLPAHLKLQIRRELDRLELLLEQIATVEREQDALLAASRPAGGTERSNPVAMLLDLKSLGPNFAAALWTEAFWRQFANRRQIASYAGLAATPWRSGGIEREQGVSKAGNPRLRTMMIQLAWLWIRHQPQSALTQWFNANSPRGRKRTIVALARKLLVALWKYVTAGVVIEGAVMKSA